MKHGFLARWQALCRIRFDHLHTQMARTLYRFAFTRSDRRAIGILACVIALTVCLRAYGLVRPAKEWNLAPGDLPDAKMEFTPKTTLHGNQNNKDMETQKTLSDTTRPKKRYNPPQYMVRKKFTVDLNKADTFDLQEIHGIGPAFAKRIVKYRESLGGFVCIEQLHEVWGIDSSLFENIKTHVYIKDARPVQININEADIRALKRHPYLDYFQAKEIYLYRQQYGAFALVDDVRQVNLMDSGTFFRIAPYLCVENDTADQ
ncbi:MAG: helix-hairpin-helix domain-containing protein [Bacteroides sp.]|nr:helix-hairpin-helix domain-containing protein [Ruminococcus flavefaciens]MCM1555084.1 helix-hairpin-helix domain-containing protein [Bacteroides sp.]MCM1555465.1 helix-hairpin-helix domain-containing protein [Bacteroides sp.]